MFLMSISEKPSLQGIVSFFGESQDRAKYVLNALCDHIPEMQLEEVIKLAAERIPQPQRLEVLNGTKQSWNELQELAINESSESNESRAREAEEKVSYRRNRQQRTGRPAVVLKKAKVGARSEDDSVLESVDELVQKSSKLAMEQGQEEEEEEGGREESEEEEEEPEEEEEEDQELEEEEEDGGRSLQQKQLIESALRAAESSLEWWLVTGPYLEENWRGKDLEELAAELEKMERVGGSSTGGRSCRDEEEADPASLFTSVLERLGEYLRAELLEKRTVVELRQRAGRSKGNKQDLIRFLAKKYAAVARDFLAGKEAEEDAMELFTFLSVVPMVAPTKQAQQELRSDPEGKLKLLSDKAVECSEMARLAALSRDAHVAYVWNLLGKSNTEVIQKLNDWMETSLSRETWCQRRRRGNLLLRFPAFAYQNVIKLDVRRGSLSPALVLEHMNSDLELQKKYSVLEARFSMILGSCCDEGEGERKQDVDLMDEEEEEEEAELHVHGYQIYQGLLCDAVNDDWIKIVDESSRRLGHLIFNDRDDGGGDNKRSQMELYRIHDRKDARYRTAFEKALRTAVCTLFPSYKEGGMVVLRSDPGCQAQRAHTDYTPTDQNGLAYDWSAENENQIPLSVLVALMDDTYFDVWPEAIRFKEQQDYIQCKQLRLNAGDVVVFRGDLVHAGGSSSQLNLRIHAYLEAVSGEFQRLKHKDGTEATHFMDNKRYILPRGAVMVASEF